MTIVKTTLSMFLAAICTASANSVVRVVHVGGDVPKPGSVRFEADVMTIDTVMAGVGLDLEAFYAKAVGDNDGKRCPLRIEIFREGTKTTYNPSVDEAVMRAHGIKLYDTISVTDFRKHPEKIELRKQRIERMLELGSTEIGDELISLATLQHEYEEWRADANAAPKELDEYLRAVASRLVKEGKGQKIIGLLELRISSLNLDGLGLSHPVIKSTTHVLQTYREVSAK